MNWLDIVLILLIGISVWTSFSKGLTREVIGLLSVIVGIFLGVWMYGTPAAMLEPHVESKSVRNFLGFLIVFVLVMMLGSLISWVLAKLLKVTGLSFFDRLLGAGFGAVRGLLVAAAVVMALLAFTPGAKADTPPQSVVNSMLAPYVIDAARVFVAAAPREMKDGFHKSYAQVKSAWEDALKKGIQKVPAQEKEKNERKI